MKYKRYSVGELIRSIRESLGLAQVWVCGGLCSQNAFQKIERGDAEPGTYLVSLLFERMGLSVNKYGTAWSWKECMEMGQRGRIIECLRQGSGENQEELAQLIVEYRAVAKKVNYQEQFIGYAELIGGRSARTGEEAREKAGQAFKLLRLTNPRFEAGQMEKLWYTRIERALLTYAAENLWRSGQEEGLIILKGLLENAEKKIPDEEELAQIYPPIALILTELFWEGGDSGGLHGWEGGDSGGLHGWGGGGCEVLRYCGRALMLLQNSQNMNGRLPLLKCRLRMWREFPGQLEGAKLEEEERNIGALEALLAQYQVKESSQEEIYAAMIEERLQGIPMDELFRGLRKGRGLTGAEVSEGVCEPENYSRIERGVTAPYPKNYQELMKRLGRAGYHYYPNVVCADYRGHLLYREAARAISKFQYREADEKLSEVEKILDMDERINQQSIQFSRAVVDRKLGRIDSTQKQEKLWECLRLTMPEGAELESYPLTHMEMKILNAIAMAEADKGNYAEEIKLLSAIRHAHEKRPLYRKNNVGAYFLVIYNLACALGDNDQYGEAGEMAEQYAAFACEEGKAFTFLSLCYLAVWSQEQILIKEACGKEIPARQCLPKFEQIIYAAEAVGEYKIVEVVKRHCLDFYEVSF